MPRYETHFDRERQHDVAEEYAATRGLAFVMTDPWIGWDAEFFEGERLVALAEIKGRNCSRFEFETYKIERRKIDRLIAAARQRRVRCGLLVEFADGERVKLTMTREWLATHAPRPATILRRDRAGEREYPAYEWSNALWEAF